MIFLLVVLFKGKRLYHVFIFSHSLNQISQIIRKVLCKGKRLFHVFIFSQSLNQISQIIRKVLSIDRQSSLSVCFKHHAYKQRV